VRAQKRDGPIDLRGIIEPIPFRPAFQRFGVDAMPSEIAFDRMSALSRCHPRTDEDIGETYVVHQTAVNCAFQSLLRSFRFVSLTFKPLSQFLLRTITH
jgi:hypothetical protein